MVTISTIGYFGEKLRGQEQIQIGNMQMSHLHHFWLETQVPTSGLRSKSRPLTRLEKDRSQRKGLDTLQRKVSNHENFHKLYWLIWCHSYVKLDNATQLPLADWCLSISKVMFVPLKQNRWFNQFQTLSFRFNLWCERWSPNTTCLKHWRFNHQNMLRGSWTAVFCWMDQMWRTNKHTSVRQLVMELKGVLDLLNAESGRLIY